ncbi:hypothetical protein [Flavobacterium sp.]|uniref:hypothetical protein n=1 Tax=Flavobacterium sp. TaxID=239 RepID=UPI002622EDFA|nr:hypothetical protein [Flavobacterium sp.]
MRKITLLLAFIGMISLSSCTVNEVRDTPVDNDTISEVFEINRSFTASNNYNNFIQLPHSIFSSDMILMYRLTSTSGPDVWKIQPETYFFNDGTLDFGYDFDFTQEDIQLFMRGNDLGSVPSNFRINQIFRIVIVPGFFGKSASNTVDLNDYNAVIKAYNIDDSKVTVLK